MIVPLRGLPGPPLRALVCRGDMASLERDQLAPHGVDAEVVAEPDLATLAVAHQVFDALLVAAGGACGLAEAFELRMRAAPTPLVLIARDAQQVHRAVTMGVRFVLRQPLHLGDVLTAIERARALQLPPGTVEARVVERYFGALGAQDWDGLGELCAEDVVYHLPAPGPLGRMVVGRAALRAHAEQVFAHFREPAFDSIKVYAESHGIVARYRSSWSDPGGERRHLTGAVAFRLAGERIARIGVELERLGAAPELPAPDLQQLVHQRLEELATKAELSARERQVLDLLVLGRNTGEIALVLGIAERTVKFHQRNVLTKLGADSRHDLIRLLL